MSRESQQDVINEIKRQQAENEQRYAGRTGPPDAPRPDAKPFTSSSSGSSGSVSSVSSISSVICSKLETISAVELWNTELPPLKYIVKDILPQGLSILCAPSKYGKSWFSLDLCLSVAAGAPFLGHETEKTGVLYLALEDGYRRLKKRMGLILKGGQPPEGFDFTVKAGTIDSGLSEQVNDYLKEKPGTGLIVIDVLQRVRSAGMRGAGGYSLDYADMGVLKNIADTHQICVLVIHHLRKLADDADPFNMISGTNGIMGAADTIFLICKKTRADKEATLKMIGRDIETNDLIIVFDPDVTYKWRLVGTAEERTADNERLEYDNDPVVRTIRHLLLENPIGVEITASEFMTVMVRYTDTMFSPKQIGRAFSNLTEKLFKHDRIIYKPGNSKTRKHSFYRHEDKIVSIFGHSETVQEAVIEPDDDTLPI